MISERSKQPVVIAGFFRVTRVSPVSPIECAQSQVANYRKKRDENKKHHEYVHLVSHFGINTGESETP